ncbi:hypothetical protein [Bradyrhizobium sp. BRP22]|nr:hypothetical protein [Bradyrhizobium sp. BRP22]
MFPTIRGTYRDDGEYSFLDIVALNGSSFVARADSPGRVRVTAGN